MSRKLFAGLVMFVVLQAIAPLVAQDEDQLGIPTEIIKAFKNPSSVFASASLTANDKTTLDNAAKYYAWRVTWLENVALPEKLAVALKEFEQFYSGQGSQVLKAGATSESVKFFNTKLIEYLKPVFDRKFESNRVSSIYAAQMLPIMAKSKSPEVGKYLLELVKDPNGIDAIKLYVRGLREYPVVRTYPTTFEARKFDDMAPDIERVKVISAYIERDWPKTENPEELAAFKYLRREAVQALAAVQAPAVTLKDQKRQPRLEGPVAVKLLQVIAKGKGGLQPETSLSERCEAALGLCHFKLGEVPDYQPQLGVYAVGVTVSDFVNKYRADFANFNGKKKAPEMSWKIYADKLKLGLDTLQKESAKHPAGSTMKGTVDGMVEQTKLMLDAVIKHQPVDNSAAIAYRSWIMKQKPAKNDVFGGGVKAPPVDLDFEAPGTRDTPDTP